MPKQLLPLITAAVAPTVASDATAGYFVGQTWLDTATNTLYICTGVGTGAATWVIILASSSSVATSTIQGRVTAGTGAIETLTIAQVKTLLNYTVADLAAVPTSRTVSAGTGLTGGGALSANITLTVAYGATGSTACVGNDSRLSNSRTPTAHAISLVTAANTARFFGRITAAGGVGEELTGIQATTLLSVVVGDGGAGGTKGLVPAPAAGDAAANKVLGAGGSWIVQAAAGAVVPASRAISAGTGLTGGGDLSADRTLSVSFGATASTACIGNDARLSDARTPTAHVLDSGSHTISGKTAGQVLLATTATAFAFTTISGDATLSSTGVLTISAAAVALADMANVATATILGRVTAATGAVEALTGTNVRTICGLAIGDTPTLAGLILGTDPSGSQLLRVGGAGRFAGGASPATPGATDVLLGAGRISCGDTSVTSIQTAGGITAAGNIVTSRSADAVLDIGATTTSTGVSARASFTAANSAGNAVFLTMCGTALSSSTLGSVRAGTVELLTTGSVVALKIGNTTTAIPIKFGIGNAEVAEITSTGNSLLTSRVAIKATQASTTAATGAFTVDGGAGILGALNVGDTSAASIKTAGGITISDTKIMTSNTSFTNGAGAAAGTITNAPAAGNPTKWIPINDNGVTRHIPAW